MKLEQKISEDVAKGSKIQPRLTSNWDGQDVTSKLLLIESEYEMYITYVIGEGAGSQVTLQRLT